MNLPPARTVGGQYEIDYSTREEVPPKVTLLGVIKMCLRVPHTLDPKLREEVLASPCNDQSLRQDGD